MKKKYFKIIGKILISILVFIVSLFVFKHWDLFKEFISSAFK